MATPQPPILIADARGIDFLNSIATPVDTPVDWIADGAGLIAWFRQSVTATWKQRQPLRLCQTWPEEAGAHQCLQHLVNARAD